jgi:hypothetical protein
VVCTTRRLARARSPGWAWSARHNALLHQARNKVQSVQFWKKNSWNSGEDSGTPPLKGEKKEREKEKKKEKGKEEEKKKEEEKRRRGKKKERRIEEKGKEGREGVCVCQEGKERNRERERESN